MCNNASLLHTGKYSGQPTEGALLVAAKAIGVQDRRSSTQRSQETSFSSETKYMEVVYAEREHGSSPYLQQHHRHAGDVKYLKGALEVILPQCVTYLSHAGDLQLLSPAILDRVYSYASELSNDGLRVLATACGTTHNQLVFLGIAGLRDPLRAGVADAVHRIKGSGATVMMITGDAESTAVSIARLAGIYDPSLAGQRILSGREIEELVAMGDDALSSVIDSVAVCYRTSPRQKLSIVRALQSRGHVVAMTGDGVNDASALKCADIGVAMGSGTDVAKEAADMVVVDDNFATIVAAIEEGKSIFFNIKNFITFQLSTSVAALSLVALNNMIGRPNPLNPMQILWINIIMDGPLAQSLGVEIVDPAVMQRPPRKRNEEIISRPVQYRIITSGMLILLGTMYIFLHEMEDGAIVTKRDLTMTFTTFVMFDMFNALACRHNSRSIFEMSWNSNSAFLLAAAFSIIGQILVVYFPPLQRVFRTESLTFEDISFVIALSSSMVLLDSLRKRYFPHIFTENLQSMSDGSAKKGLKSGAFMV